MPPSRKSPRSSIRGANVIVFAAAGGLLLLAAAYLWLLGGPRPPGSAAIGGPFTLTRADGRVVTEQDFRGRLLLVYFGYTSCPDVCPTTLSAIADAMQILGSRADHVQPLFISVDPERDRPATVGAYVGKFSPAIVGLTGTRNETRDVEREYRIVSILHKPTAAGAYAVDHTSILYLMAPDGRHLASFSALDSGPELARKIAAFLGPSSGVL